MGLFKMSCSSYERPISRPNPNPSNYSILRCAEIKNHLVVEVRYYDCVTYEGRKILLYKDCSYSRLKLQSSIDPHFSDAEHMLSPFARFEPTEEGWQAAIFLCGFFKGFP